MAKRQVKTKSRLGLICVMFVVLLICGFIYFKTMELKNELMVLNSKLDSIQEDISSARQELENKKEDEKYQYTDDYKKDMAKEIYGLRDPDETIFLPGETEKNYKDEEKYRQTDDYRKDEAKDIYGLRDPDETIFLPNEPEGN